MDETLKEDRQLVEEISRDKDEEHNLSDSVTLQKHCTSLNSFQKKGNGTSSISEDSQSVTFKSLDPQSIKTSRPAITTFVNNVDISRPMRTKRGEGVPVENGTFANLSFPISVPLPGLELAYHNLSRPNLEKMRWSYLNNTDECNTLSLDDIDNLNFPDWFDPSSISSVELTFLSSCISDCDNYTFIRNFIISSYLKLPKIWISISSVAKNLPNFNLVHISQIHCFLQSWGLINFDACTAPDTCLSSNCVGAIRKNILSLINIEESGHNENNLSSLIVYESALNSQKQLTPPIYQFQSSRLNENIVDDTESNLDFDYPHSTHSEDSSIPLPHSNFEPPCCFLCKSSCYFFVYHHIKLPLILCPICFKEGRAPSDMPSCMFNFFNVSALCNLIDGKNNACFKAKSDNPSLANPSLANPSNTSPSTKHNVSNRDVKWTDETILQLLCSLEKKEEIDWNETSKFLNTMNPDESGVMNLRKNRLTQDNNRLRTCRKYFKRKQSQQTYKDGSDTQKKFKSIGYTQAECMQKFLSLNYTDFLLMHPSHKKSLIELSENVAMVTLTTVYRLFGGEIAAAGAMAGLEFLSEYTEEKYKDEKDVKLILSSIPDEGLVNELAFAILKGAVKQAHKIIVYEDMAVEFLVQHAVDLQCKKISCKTKLVTLLDQQ